VHDRIGGPESPISFPTEVIQKVPIGAGPLVIEATPRNAAGVALGGGEGQVTVQSGAIATVTIQLVSERNRPSRGRPGGDLDAGSEPGDAGMDAAADAEMAPDLASSDAGGTDAAPACTPRTHHLLANAVLSVDYGSLPRDRESNQVAVSSGFAHQHIHAFVGWMRFGLHEVPVGARLDRMRVSLVLTSPPVSIPRIGILYSATDVWDPESLTSDQAESIVRTAPVSDDLGPPAVARGDYDVDVARYRPFWSADLADGTVTLGMISTTPADRAETWADFYGLQPSELAPALDLDTCE
jgi:hypothetical protein